MKLSTPADIGRVIRDRRKRLGLSQAELSDLVGVSRQWIGFLESGKPGAELGLVLTTVRELGLNLDVFSDEDRERRRAGAKSRPIDLDRVLNATLQDASA